MSAEFRVVASSEDVTEGHGVPVKVGETRIAIFRLDGKLYATSVGAKFKRATLESDIGDLPRLEMFYYTNPQRWHDHLSGRGRGYMRRRQILRQLREVMSKPWERV